MESTDKTDIDRQIISSELLNENSLLVISKSEEDEYPKAQLTYEKYGEVHTKTLARLTPDVKIEHNDKMIAIFQKKGKVLKRHRLVSVYDLSIQDFVGTSNMYLHYDCYKYEGAKVKTLAPPKK